MFNTLQKVKQALESLRQMSPEEWSTLDNDTWQLAQDIRDCCKALADRVDVLEMLAPLPAVEPSGNTCECQGDRPDCLCQPLQPDSLPSTI